MQPRTRRTVKIIGLGFFVIILAFFALIYFVSDSFIRQMAGSKAADKIGRNFSIDGPIHIDWDWTTPQVHLSQIHLANLPNSADPDMVAIDNIDFHIKIWRLLEGQLNLPDITIGKPTIILEKIDDKTNNWTFPSLSKANAAATSALPTKRGNFPIIGQLTVKDGKLVYRDKTKNLDLALTINTATGGGGDESLFQLAGNGKLQDKDFALNAEGGSLSMLRNSNADYPLHLHIKMGETVADINGTFHDPVKMEGIDTKMDLKGDSLSNLFYMTLLPLPPTPAYHLSGHLVKQGDTWTFENFNGKVGNSDLEGTLSYDLSGTRGFMKADLTSKLLDMKDLASFTGAKPQPRQGEQTTPGEMKQVEKEKTNPRLLPDVQLDLTRLRATDLDVTLKAAQILAPGVPMNDMNVRFLLKDGVLRLDPLSFGMASGKINGDLVLDGSKDISRVESDLTITRLSLKQFFKGTSFEPMTKGFFSGHFQLDGTGKSLADVMGDSNGRVTMVMAGGTISQLIVDAAGLDIGNTAPILLGKDKATDVRCAVADFGVKDGQLNSNVFVFDTAISNIHGDMRINLKDEVIDGKIETDPKSPTITAHAPIVITGPLKHPSIALDVKETAARGAGAAVLSVFLTPLAGILPFIELGNGEDSDCNDLIAQTREAVKAVPPPAQPATP